MNGKILFASVTTLAFLGLGAPAAALTDPVLTTLPWETIDCTGESPVEMHTFVEPSNPELTVAVHTYCHAESLSPGRALDTDCTRPTYGLTGWAWTSSYSGKVDAANSGLSASGVLAAFNAAGNTWDAATSAEIFGSFTSGGRGRDAGRYDGVNQVGFKRLGSGTIAVTTTWYYTSTGQAVESDAAYSTRYGWSLSGEAGKFDVENIGTHEIGHTWGLDDLYDAADACLTMYGYGGYGETYARTLGDGDISGLRAIYG